MSYLIAIKLNKMTQLKSTDQPEILSRKFRSTSYKLYKSLGFLLLCCILTFLLKKSEIKIQ